MNLQLEKIADNLFMAERNRKPIAPLTQMYPELSVKDAYMVQLEVMSRKVSEGRKVIGKKVGLTSVAMQKMLGVNEPDYGHLFDDMKVEDNSIVKMNELLSPKVEAEIGFILGEDLKGPNITYLDVMMATEYVVPTLEIIDSRIEDWKIQLVDTVADNGSSAKVVTGSQLTKIEGIDLRTVGMVLYKNGEMVATGAGAAALGHPAHAIAWLANKLSEFDITLKAGELILPGALSAALTVQKGDKISAHFGKLGSVSVIFE
ncbi:2-keto-4-pentenoate hydratase [Neobacillus thermocopriae]|uniref:2-keto-4-pentenoate hydratase n=1 Tax=Neobacillus thermocopriae TaxID=1215031 RepID=A0A6B3TRZ6_9BACI|nr:2-keto-4-pentenoate hydratase [Neobacillus thermocopriae]MED3624714.1 2-keto-4-pentenoate hydratase [Neobacillus thermocopriae]MED3713136.1 2-keto-4-pentenoate hydratase [Neobacillus thermocopriae]NEX78487.1 2-keto-4-pentenoate hydratase [Neobacillus thermocopriae]